MKAVNLLTDRRKDLPPLYPSALVKITCYEAQQKKEKDRMSYSKPNTGPSKS